MVWALTAALLLAGCGKAGSEQAREPEVQSVLVPAPDSAARPPALAPSSILSLEEFTQRTGVDSTTLAQVTRPVMSLDSVLAQLSLLHWEHDAARSDHERREIDERAYLLHLEADTYEGQIDRHLDAGQHTRFHAYLADRAKAVGLPLDDSHGPGLGTVGNLQSIGHPDSTGHTGQTHNHARNPRDRDSARSARP